MIGQQWPFFFINAYLFFFLNTVYGMSAVTIGNIFLVARIWDAINDPLMGMLADRTRSRWGSYRPWMFFGSIPVAIFAALCFCQFDFGDTGKIIWVAVVYICFGMSNTASCVPYGAMTTVLTTDYNERSVLGMVRELGSTVGNLSVTYLAPVLLAALSTVTRHSYAFTELILGVCAIGWLGICFAGTKEREIPPKSEGNVFKSFKVLKSNVPAICLCLYFLIIDIFYMLRFSFNVYYTEYYLQNPNGALILTFMAFSPLLLLFFVPNICKRIGKRNQLILGAVLVALSGLITFFAGHNMPLNYLGGFVSGWGQTLAFSGIWASVADVADYGEFKNGVHAPGVMYSVLSFAMKLGTSVSSYVIAFILSLIAFDNTAAVQTEAVQNGIHSGMSWGIVIVGVLAVFAILPYSLSEKKMAEVRAKLDSHEGEG